MPIADKHLLKLRHVNVAVICNSCYHIVVAFILITRSEM